MNLIVFILMGTAVIISVDDRYDAAVDERYKLDVRGSVRHTTILTVKTQQDATVYQNFIIPYFK
jgi:hypothetical protein